MNSMRLTFDYAKQNLSKFFVCACAPFLLISIFTGIVNFVASLFGFTAGATLSLASNPDAWMNLIETGDTYYLEEILTMSELGMNLFSIVISFISSIATLYAYLLVYYNVMEMYKGKDTTITTGIEFANKCFLKSLGLTIVSGFIVLVGYCLCCIPGIIAAYALTPLYYLLVLKNGEADIIPLISESYEIMKGHKMNLFIELIVFNLVVSVFSCLFSILTCGIGLTIVNPVTFGLSILFIVVFMETNVKVQNSQTIDAQTENV